MNYLSAFEIAKKWNISSRMVAYYCETERIAGALKKGKTWLIPEDARKPMDRRTSKEKTKIDIPYMQIAEMRQADREGLDVIYRTSEVLNNLALSRETLRYYEEIGLIRPKRSKFSQYREFDFMDVSRLMAIDFYKKRGFSAGDIKEKLLQKDTSECLESMEKQKADIEAAIAEMQKIRDRLQETACFCKEAIEQQGIFTIRELPLYQVRETMNHVLNLEEYKEKVVQYLNVDAEDILSNMVRVLTFDENGYTGSKICIVKKAEEETKKEGIFLESGKCAHIIMEADNNDNSIMEEMLSRSYQWGKEHNVRFRGTAYIFIRFITLDKQTERNFYEIWIPLKE